MFDYKYISENALFFEKETKRRGLDISFDSFIENYRLRLSLTNKVETLRAEKNKVSKEVPILQKQGKDISSIKEEMKNLSENLLMLDAELKKVEDKLFAFVSALPNLLDNDVPAGGKENNKVIYAYGEERTFTFTPKDHYTLLTNLNLVDFERGAKLGGNGSWVYRGLGAQLEWSLLNYFMEFHRKNNYEFILPPHILGVENGFTAGQFPKFADEVYYVQLQEKSEMSKFLLPTSETALVNLYRNEIISDDKLPMKFYSYTPCYRVEAGSYRTAERGTIRGHQFNKVEMFQITKPENSDNALNEMIQNAQELVKGLGLSFRTTLLAALDTSASMVKTCDIEVFIPSIGYKEVSSVSNSKTYQCKRGNIRYRNSNKEISFPHTLNGSGLATSRLIPAICEQNQQEDGSVLIPEVLQKWMGGNVIKSDGTLC